MIIKDILSDKSTKGVQKRAIIIEAINKRVFTIDDFMAIKTTLDERGIGILLEAMEAVTGNDPSIADKKWLEFATEYVTSINPSVKRESSRVIGNIAHLFPSDLEAVISKIIANTTDGGAVVRWASAYALGKIILIEQYAKSNLFDTLTSIADKENDNAVKNQYLNGLKKAKKLRN